MTSKNLVGTSIGHIRLVQQLGAGGMGEVYRGVDTRLEREVAVKTILSEHRPDADMKARFVREAQLLSKLDHPAICKVYDLVEGDQADYLIFELVAGDTLSQRMHNRDLTRPEVLRLGEKIARALATAHGERIVHRDLKPDNIMVTPEGGIKILDFGISTVLSEPNSAATLAELQRVAMSQEWVIEADSELEVTAPLGAPENGDLESGPTVVLSVDQAEPSEVPTRRLDVFEATPSASSSASDKLTRQGSVVGTLSYMSPEQARGEQVTEACDVYSLGIVLQELLTGQRAYEQLAPLHMLSKVAHGESRPMHDEDPEIVTLVTDLKRRLPEYRPTAEQAAERIRDIVEAPARRRRQRLRSISIATAFTVLSVGLILLTFWYTRAKQEAKRANLAIQQTIEERDRANREAESASAVTKFLTNLLQDAGPEKTLGRDVSARELLLRGADRIETELADQPLVRSGVQEILGNSMVQLGDFERAQSLLESALEIRQQELPGDHPAQAGIHRNLAILFRQLGNGEKALHHLDAAQAAVEAQEDSSAELAEILYERGSLLSQLLGRPADAEVVLRQALEVRQQHFGEQSMEVGETWNSLGILAWSQGDPKAAKTLFEQALAILEKHLDPNHFNLAALLNNLGILYRDEGRLSQAEASFRRALTINRASLGETHPDVASTHFGLGRLFLLRQQPAQASEHFATTLAIRKQALGFDHYATGRCMIWLAASTRLAGELSEARVLFEEGKLILQDSGFGARYQHEIEEIQAGFDG